jgi:hypothetical protein
VISIFTGCLSNHDRAHSPPHIPSSPCHGISEPYTSLFSITFFILDICSHTHASVMGSLFLAPCTELITGQGSQKRGGQGLGSGGLKKTKVRLFVYYETIKREINTKIIYECRCDGKLKTKTEGSRLFGYTRLSGGLEHLPSSREIVPVNERWYPSLL